MIERTPRGIIFNHGDGSIEIVIRNWRCNRTEAVAFVVAVLRAFDLSPVQLEV
jgi:hypothetical protein